jgi:hypothetical protein
MSSHAGSQNLPFFAPSCLRSTYATDNPIPIKDRMASERPGSPAAPFINVPTPGSLRIPSVCGRRASYLPRGGSCA